MWVWNDKQYPVEGFTLENEISRKLQTNAETRLDYPPILILPIMYAGFADKLDGYADYHQKLIRYKQIQTPTKQQEDEFTLAHDSFCNKDDRTILPVCQGGGKRSKKRLYGKSRSTRVNKNSKIRKSLRKKRMGGQKY